MLSQSFGNKKERKTPMVVRSDATFVPGGRIGVRNDLTPVLAGLALGKPNRGPSPDGKTTATWYFDTPEGPVSLYDFWDNPGNMSIGGTNKEAAEFLHRFLDKIQLGRRCPNP